MTSLESTSNYVAGMFNHVAGMSNYVAGMSLELVMRFRSRYCKITNIQ
jgi:hypothetical protein